MFEAGKFEILPPEREILVLFPGFSAIISPCFPIFPMFLMLNFESNETTTLIHMNPGRGDGSQGEGKTEIIAFSGLTNNIIKILRDVRSSRNGRSISRNAIIS